MSKRKRRRPKKPSANYKGQKQKPAKGLFLRGDSMTHAQRKSRDRFRTRVLPILILLLISILAYANAWPNNLTWDDAVFGIGNRLSGIEWTDVGRFFTQDVWAAIGLDTGLYRPILLMSISLDIEIFGSWVAGLHLVNILFHALTTVTVFGLTRYLLVKLDSPFPRASIIALLAALVFAVHPIHTEVVNSIFNRSEMLATLGLAGGLWWFLPAVEKTPWKAWGLLGLIYLLVMMSRETGIVLPGIAVVCLWFTTPGSWQQRARRCLPVFWLLIPMTVYLVLRANALEMPTSMQEMNSGVGGAVAKASSAVIGSSGAVGGSSGAEAGAGGSTVGQQSIPVLGAYLDARNLIRASQIWFDAFSLMLWPDPLLTFHDLTDTNPWLAICAQIALLAFALYRVTQNRPGLFIGLIFFYLAFLPSSRIVGEAGIRPHLAERYLYMPSAGATIMLAFGLAWFAQKFSLKRTVILTVAVLILLTPVTWARNADWVSTAALAEADYNKGAKSNRLLQAYISSLYTNDELVKASMLCTKHENKVKRFWYISSYCGQIYASLRQYEKAKLAFGHSLTSKTGRSSSHYALGVMYLQMNRRDEARKHFELASETEPQAFLKEYLAAEGLMRLYPSNRSRLLEARAHLTKSIELHPQYFHARQRLEDLDQILASFRVQDKK